MRFRFFAFGQFLSNLKRFATPILAFTLLAGCNFQSVGNSDTVDLKKTDSKNREFEKDKARIEPFFKTMGKASNSDWLASHNEPGQTFAEFIDAQPVKPDAARQTIYALPLGTFSSSDRKRIQITVEFLAEFYDLPVKQTKALSLKAASLRPRRNRFTKHAQFKTGDIIEHLLKPEMPNDAAVLIAFTKEDLYLDDSTNFVFGEASFDSRVGVWSLARLDDNTDPRNVLLRMMKIAAHETGHMFSMKHCTRYECLMSGTNNLAETDRRPVDTCPECTAKVCWLSDISFADRYRRLIQFCRKNGLDEMVREFEAKLRSVESMKP
jgi:archaemetzincin